LDTRGLSTADQDLTVQREALKAAGVSSRLIFEEKACGTKREDRDEANAIRLRMPATPKGFVPLSKTGAELLFEVFSQRYERGSTLVTSNLPFDEWTDTFGMERLTGALLDRLTHHVPILEMNGDSYRLAESRHRRKNAKQNKPK